LLGQQDGVVDHLGEFIDAEHGRLLSRRADRRSAIRRCNVAAPQDSRTGSLHPLPYRKQRNRSAHRDAGLAMVPCREV